MSELIATAWDAVKGEGDASYGASHGVLKAELKDRADAIIRTGSTNKELMGGDDLWSVYDRFEAKFKELHQAEVEASKHGEVVEGAEAPVAVVDDFAAPVPLDAAPAEGDVGNGESNTDEKPLNKMSRAELDEIASEEFGFNPSDYSNKEEIVAAIEEARNK
jgi:hypothetical protein